MSSRNGMRSLSEPLMQNVQGTRDDALSVFLPFTAEPVPTAIRSDAHKTMVSIFRSLEMKHRKSNWTSIDMKNMMQTIKDKMIKLGHLEFFDSSEADGFHEAMKILDLNIADQKAENAKQTFKSVMKSVQKKFGKCDMKKSNLNCTELKEMLMEVKLKMTELGHADYFDSRHADEFNECMRTIDRKIAEENGRDVLESVMNSQQEKSGKKYMTSLEMKAFYKVVRDEMIELGHADFFYTDSALEFNMMEQAFDAEVAGQSVFTMSGTPLWPKAASELVIDYNDTWDCYKLFWGNNPGNPTRTQWKRARKELRTAKIDHDLQTREGRK